MKKASEKQAVGELRAEYNIRDLKGIARGKYAERYKEGSNVVLLEPDVAAAFPNEKAVNDALRLLISVARSASRKED